MYLVINKCVTAVKVSNFSGHYLRNRSTLDIGVLGYIYIYIYIYIYSIYAIVLYDYPNTTGMTHLKMDKENFTFRTPDRAASTKSLDGLR